MSSNEEFKGARGQIVWILALMISTAAIIYLEQLDIGAPTPPIMTDQFKTTNVTFTAKTVTMLAEAEARFAAAPNDPEAAASLLLAVTVAVQAGAMNGRTGRARVEAIQDRAAMAGIEWQPLMVWVAITFPDLPPEVN